MSHPKQPPDLVLTEEEISNFDHEVPDGLEEKLKTSLSYCRYPAWNFHATVWWSAEKSQFAIAPMVYGSPQPLLHAPTLKEVMTTASDVYGYA